MFDAWIMDRGSIHQSTGSLRNHSSTGWTTRTPNTWQQRL